MSCPLIQSRVFVILFPVLTSHRSHLSSLQVGSKTLFLHCLLIWLLSCWYSNQKGNMIITMSSFRLLKPQCSLRKAAFEPVLNPLPAMFIFRCWDSHSLYAGLLILSFTNQFWFWWPFSYYIYYIFVAWLLTSLISCFYHKATTYSTASTAARVLLSAPIDFLKNCSKSLFDDWHEFIYFWKQ